MTVQDDVKELKLLTSKFNKKTEYYKLFARMLLHLFTNQESIRRDIGNINDQLNAHYESIR